MAPALVEIFPLKSDTATIYESMYFVRPKFDCSAIGTSKYTVEWHPKFSASTNIDLLFERFII